MPRRNDISKILIIGSLLMGPAFLAYGKAQTPQAQQSLATRCAPDLDAARERVFANPDGKHWKEFAAMKQVPHLDGHNGEMAITVRSSRSGRNYVRTIEYGENSANYEGNCYDEAGLLRSMHYEVRTAWGWGYEDIREFDSAGKVKAQRTRYFDTTSNEKIDRPAQANDVPDFLKPTIYSSLAKLPIAGALKQDKHATP